MGKKQHKQEMGQKGGTKQARNGAKKGRNNARQEQSREARAWFTINGNICMFITVGPMKKL